MDCRQRIYERDQCLSIKEPAIPTLTELGDNRWEKFCSLVIQIPLICYHSASVSSDLKVLYKSVIIIIIIIRISMGIS